MTSSFIRITLLPSRSASRHFPNNSKAIYPLRRPRSTSRPFIPLITSRVTMTASKPFPPNSKLEPCALQLPLPPSAPPLYSVAPMMDVTDRHYRALARLISRHATLYTEMVVDRTIIHNPKLRLLELRLPPYPSQHPVVLQLGGSEPEIMGAAAKLASLYPYLEMNINCGCPSPKVADNGCFGAALMRTPQLVADIVKNVSANVNVPVTVKCRLGLDWDTSFEPLREFVQIVHEQGNVQHFIIHARNAVLGGLSPAQNRSIPPLRYDAVYRLIEEFPHIRFSINGGIRTVDDVLSHLQRGVYGVMVGRGAMDAPWQALCEVDSRVYGQPNVQDDGSVTTRRHVLRDYVTYAKTEIKETACSVRAIVKPILNLFHGERNGKLWRRSIDEGLREGLELEEIIDNAIKMVPDEVLDALPGQKVVFAPRIKLDERCSDERAIDEQMHVPVNGDVIANDGVQIAVEER